MENSQLNKKGSNKILFTSVIIIILFVFGLSTNWFGLSDNKQEIKIETGNSPVLGNANAPVTIFEFSDFSCPYCAAADGKNEQVISYLKSKNPNWKAPIPLIIENYVNTGKARIVFKYAKGHGTGETAHIIAYCLDEQNLFWKFHDLAFANQENISNIAEMKKLAISAGANSALLEECINSEKYDSRLKEEDSLATSIGITGTPSFVINEKLISGAQSYEEFEKIIEQELKK